MSIKIGVPVLLILCHVSNLDLYQAHVKRSCFGCDTRGIEIPAN